MFRGVSRRRFRRGGFNRSAYTSNYVCIRNVQFSIIERKNIAILSFNELLNFS